ncbi:hypothetical protein C9374_014515 [Naegleria lovaniensis]|uniref:Uncharacterized protein n=1 Tax=Naegleria lovaniensis TaxID=51637 RepID=A0AA88GY13_NAELO|nr:uncharacterized protein C9374_014515 [Naegleria lovaniensis]KAG2389115.1 hypothetical protein C9374_014515 [Naegleria lovaniensis]
MNYNFNFAHQSKIKQAGIFGVAALLSVIVEGMLAKRPRYNKFSDEPMPEIVEYDRHVVRPGANVLVDLMDFSRTTFDKVPKFDYRNEESVFKTTLHPPQQ